MMTCQLDHSTASARKIKTRLVIRKQILFISRARSCSKSVFSSQSTMDRASQRTKILSNHFLQPSFSQIISSNACLSYTPPELNELYDFDIKEMRKVLDGHNVQHRDWLFNLIIQSKLFNPKKAGEKVFVSPDYNQSMEQQREITMKRIAYLLERGVFQGWLTANGIESELTKLAFLEVINMFDHSLAIKIGVHLFLW